MNHSPESELEQIVRAKFARLSTPALMHRIDNAPDFGYDDEAAELNRRLRPNHQEWIWARDDHGRERVTIVTCITTPARDIRNGDILTIDPDDSYVVRTTRHTPTRVCLALEPLGIPYTRRTRRLTRAPHTALTIRRPDATR